MFLLFHLFRGGSRGQLKFQPLVFEGVTLWKTNIWTVDGSETLHHLRWIKMKKKTLYLFCDISNSTGQCVLPILGYRSSASHLCDFTLRLNVQPSLPEFPGRFGLLELFCRSMCDLLRHSVRILQIRLNPRCQATQFRVARRAMV